MAQEGASRFQLLFIAICVLLAIGLGLWLFQPSDQPSPDPQMSSAPQVSASTHADQSASNIPQSNLSPDLTTSEDGFSKARAIMMTDKGKVVFRFYPKEAPRTVQRIIELINQGFYNGLTFHRVEANFIAQTGDPTGTGYGGSGQTVEAEFNFRPHMDGAIGLAHGRDPDSGDSQFYISIGQQASLNGKYTVFAFVVEGMDVVRKIGRGDKIHWIIIE